MMLAFLGFHLEFSSLVKAEFITKIAFASNLRGPKKERPLPGELVVVNPHEQKENHPKNKLMPEDRSEMVTTVGVTSSRRVVGKVKDNRNLWAWPGFMRDGPPPSKPRGKTYSKRLRPKRGKF
jgi:hypothetical protein